MLRICYLAEMSDLIDAGSDVLLCKCIIPTLRNPNLKIRMGLKQFSEVDVNFTTLAYSAAR